MKILIFILFFVTSNVWSQCPSQLAQSRQCQTNSVFIIDVSSALTLNESALVIDYVKTMFSAMDLYGNRTVSFILYGLNSNASVGSTIPSSDYQTACQRLTDLLDQRGPAPPEDWFLHSAMWELFNAYGDMNNTVTLLSATNNESQISYAATIANQYCRSYQMSVVSLKSDDRSMWLSFPSYSWTYAQPEDLYYTYYNNQSLIVSLLDQQCNYDVNRYTVTNSTIPYSYNMTTPMPYQPNTTVTTSNHSSTCSCTTENVWNDVMLLYDVSSTTGRRGLDELTAYTQSVFTNYNIVPSYNGSQNSYNDSGINTRMGIITYGSQVILQYPFGSLSTSLLYDLPSLSYQGSSDADLLGALQLASSEFVAKGRSNTRKVIVVFSSQQQGYNDTRLDNFINQLRSINTIVVVYDYVQHGQKDVSSWLQSIATPGYFLSNTMDTDGKAMDRAMCAANCFCPSGSVPYHPSVDGTPLEGCYYASSLTSNYHFANNLCSKLNGVVSMDETYEKSRFLLSLTYDNNNIWIGMQWNNNLGAYLWNDGSLVNGSYQPWDSYYHQQGKDCVYLSPSYNNMTSWVNTDCRNAFSFVCRIPPCDSDNYCA